MCWRCHLLNNKGNENMEKIQISGEQEQSLLGFLNKRKSIWFFFILGGIAGSLPIVITFFGDSATSFSTSPFLALFVLGILFTRQSEGAIKKIKENNYQIFTTKCVKVNALGYAVVENNEILSISVKKTTKSIEILCPSKSIQAGEEIGILQADKNFWAFSLNN